MKGNKNKYLLLLSIFTFLCYQYTDAQDLTTIGSQKPFDIHGSIGAGTNFFSSNQEQASRDPFTWNLYGSLTPSIYGIAIPLSFSVTQFSKSYSQPFSRFGMTPTYKWAKLHLGYSNMSFSPLVFDGESFLGSGIELHPGKFYFAAFYGRLNKAISEDTTMTRMVEPQYSRHGYGIQVGIKDQKKEWTLEYLRAYDNIASIKRMTPDSANHLLPQSNNVLGTSWRFNLWNKVNFSGNFATSMLNRDLRFDRIDSIGDDKIPRIVDKLMPVTYSAVFNWSGQAQLGLNLGNFNTTVGYRRVQPDFKSLGVPYMLDDIEMINTNVGMGFLDGKVSLNMDFNTQRNNLNKMLSSTLRSSTGTFTGNVFASQYVNVNAMVTSSKVTQKDGLLQLDENTRMNQLMTMFMINPLLTFVDESTQHSINNSISYTRLNDHNPSTAPFVNGKNINISSNYSVYFMNKSLGISAGGQFSNYKQQENSYQSLGLNVGANMQLLPSRALSLQGTAGYFVNKNSGSVTGNNISFSFSSSFRTHKKHSFGLNMSYILTPPVNLDPLDKVRLDRIPYAVNSKIFAGGINYNYTF